MPARRIIITSSFQSAYEKFTERNTWLKKKVDRTIHLLGEDSFFSSLETHRLKGKFYGAYACSCGYDCRIIFVIEKDKQGVEYISLIDIGTHDDVY